MRMEVNLFEYQDYRSFLKDYYSYQKDHKKNFSYKYFSEKAGIKAPSFLFYVIEGKRNLTKSTILKISQAIGFNRQEEEYFEYLVFFNQAKTIAEKTQYYSRLVEIRKPIDIEIIDKDRYEYYSAWHHSVIREVVTFFDFKGDFERLGVFLVPPIRASEAKRSIALLERLGFIEQDSSGLYHQTQNLINAKPGAADAFVIEKFQISMLQMAMQAYDKVAIHDRMMTSTTFSISRETFELFKLRIRELQNQLMEMARIDNEPESVYQLTLNLFPMSRSTRND
ncbi:MAG TPA: TIGR02147 family protein [Chitinispirillaceae bacterium]|nr:TIGR02147 family protein [Chitinispirillaceae bacterium]